MWVLFVSKPRHRETILRWGTLTVDIRISKISLSSGSCLHSLHPVAGGNNGCDIGGMLAASGEFQQQSNTPCAEKIDIYQ